MKLYIKNMVCSRCKMVVKAEFEKLKIPLVSVELGEIETQKPITDQEKSLIIDKLNQFGFELIDDKKSRIIEQIKTLLINLTQENQAHISQNISAYLAENLNHDYNSLSNLFSEVEGTTIEKYYINLKIEKVKELLIYDELSLSQIADKLAYSSVAHLSSQFKKITGFTPSHFKQLKEKRRIQLENL